MSECKNDGQPSMPTDYPANKRMCGEYSGMFGCTLDQGHEGDHIAHGWKGRVLAVWPSAEKFPELLLKAQDLAEEMRKHNLTHLGQLQLR